MASLEEHAQSVADRDGLVRLVEMMVRDLAERPERWSNRDLSSFLGAVASWLDDMDGYYLNKGMEPPSNVNWGVLADVLMAARVYE